MLNLYLVSKLRQKGFPINAAYREHFFHGKECAHTQKKKNVGGKLAKNQAEPREGLDIESYLLSPSFVARAKVGIGGRSRDYLCRCHAWFTPLRVSARRRLLMDVSFYGKPIERGQRQVPPTSIVIPRHRCSGNARARIGSSHVGVSRSQACLLEVAFSWVRRRIVGLTDWQEGTARQCNCS